MGSGTLLRLAIKKYGVENFTREILFSFQTQNECLKKEAALVNSDVLKDKFCYNLAIGGGGSLVQPYGRPIYSLKATPLMIKPEKRLDDQYKYEFIRNEPAIEQWREQTAERFTSRNKKRKGVEFKFAFENATIDYFDNLLMSISKLYNNKFTHDNAKMVINWMAIKNLQDCFYIKKTAWID